MATLPSNQAGPEADEDARNLASAQPDAPSRRVNIAPLLADDGTPLTTSDGTPILVTVGNPPDGPPPNEAHARPVGADGNVQIGTHQVSSAGTAISVEIAASRIAASVIPAAAGRAVATGRADSTVIEGSGSVSADADTVVAALSVHDEAYAATDLSATVTPFALPPEWEAHRRDAIRLLTSLPQALDDADRVFNMVEEMRRFGIGANHSPEPMDNASANAFVTEAAAAGDALLAELSSDHPHLASIRLSGLVLQRTLGALQSTGRWLAEKGDLFINEFVKQLGKRGADAITFATTIKVLGGLTAIITAVLGLVASLFALLGLTL